MESPSSTITAALHGRAVCVTGGAGFIGSHLVEALLEHGATVRVIDDLSSGRLDVLPLADPRLKVYEGSILDSRLLQGAIAGCELVFHHAALVSVHESLDRPDDYRRVNVEGTRRVLEASASIGVRRLVYAASCSAYGDVQGLPQHETDPVDPTSPYATTKLDGELLVEDHAMSSGLDTVRLRYFNIFGPRQSHESAYAAVVPNFIAALESGRTPVIYGDGLQTRDFIHVLDVVDANLLAATCPGPLRGRVINIGSGRRVSILGVLESLAGAYGRSVVPDHQPPREGEVRDSEACTDLARMLIGFESKRSLADSVDEIRTSSRS